MRIALGLAALLATPARAHGGASTQSSWLQGAQALLAEPACLLLLVVLILWMASGDSASTRRDLRAALVGLGLGLLLALGGLALDLALPLLGLTLILGVAVAWGRPGPVAWRAGLAATASAGGLLMLAPAVDAAWGSRLAWLAGVLAALALPLGLGLGLLRRALRRWPGPVARLLLRVAGSWLAAVALLAAVLEASRRAG